MNRKPEDSQVVTVNLSLPRFVLIPIAHAVTGYTEKAIRRKIADGVWLENFEWVRGPDGHILIDLEGYDRWAAGERGPVSTPEKKASASGSRGMASAAVSP